MPRTGDRVKTGVKYGGRSWAESDNGYGGVRLSPLCDDVRRAARSHANEAAFGTECAFTPSKSSAGAQGILTTEHRLRGRDRTGNGGKNGHAGDLRNH